MNVFLSLKLKCRRYKNILITASLASVIAITLGCDNPFFPPTGSPATTIKLRSTPKGVIDQLIKSYEGRRLDLFKDLFSEKDNYKFYISKSFEAEYIQGGFSYLLDVVDSAQYGYVPAGPYFYWRYNEEIERHERLFANVRSIRFDPKPSYDSFDPEYGFLYKVVERSETLTVKMGKDQKQIITTVFDTVNVEIAMRGGRLNISGYHPRYGEFSYQVDVGMQVFLLKRDPLAQNLWVIEKWFDLGGG